MNLSNAWRCERVATQQLTVKADPKTLFSRKSRERVAEEAAEATETEVKNVK